MFELEQIRLGLSGYDEKLEEMGGSLDVAGARDKIAELEELSADPEFWNDLGFSFLNIFFIQLGGNVYRVLSTWSRALHFLPKHFPITSLL